MSFLTKKIKVDKGKNEIYIKKLFRYKITVTIIPARETKIQCRAQMREVIPREGTFGRDSM